jgi:hypothetical protein
LFHLRSRAIDCAVKALHKPAVRDQSRGDARKKPILIVNVRYDDVARSERGLRLCGIVPCQGQLQELQTLQGRAHDTNTGRAEGKQAHGAAPAQAILAQASSNVLLLAHGRGLVSHRSDKPLLQAGRRGGRAPIVA